jgi:hypothetical protein
MTEAVRSCKINRLLCEDNETMVPPRRKIRSAGFAAAAVAAIVVAGWLMGATAISAAASKPSTWGQILIVGDQKRGRHPSRFVAELYDPASGRFAAHPALMSHERVEETATVIPVGFNASKVLVAGGYGAGGPLASTELYDPATDRFIRGPNMSETRNTHTATVITSGPEAGRILIVGGDATEFYDPIANAFAPGPMLNGNRWSHTATTIQSGLNAGKVLLAGGLRVGTRSPASTELYDPRTNTFVWGPAMNVVREDHTATIISSGPNAGRILLVGGLGPYRDDGFVPLASTELYDPATNAFAPSRATAAMKIPRVFHTATTIASGPNAGKILIAGGQSANENPLSSTELYDPAANAFAPGPAMHRRRSGHIAIAIASGQNAGRILIAGGFGSREGGKRSGKGGVPLDSTELYDPATNTFAPGPTTHGTPGMAVAVQLPLAPPALASAYYSQAGSGVSSLASHRR